MMSFPSALFWTGVVVVMLCAISVLFIAIFKLNEIRERLQRDRNEEPEIRITCDTSHLPCDTAHRRPRPTFRAPAQWPTTTYNGGRDFVRSTPRLHRR